MALPSSFAQDGFTNPPKAKFKRLMIGSDGPSNSGKSEFAHSAPGPGIFICIDRGLDAMLDNPSPPKTRRPDFVYKTIKIPMAEGASHDDYKAGWALFRDSCYKAANNPDCRTLVIDGDSDSWELQRLAAFGKLTQIPSILYTGVNASRRLFISRLHDSGKIVIATNKVKKEYKPAWNPDGTPTLKDGKQTREWDGKSWERQGFEDQDYLWQIQLRHIYDEEKKRWGALILKCKANPEIQGEMLWGEECNMEYLVQVAYPNVPLKEWGY